jgi:GH15 family glucan-1,4-alpha-glucosidase
MLEGQRVLPIQQDETALVLWALRQHFETFRDVEFLKPLYNTLVTRPGDWLLEYRDEHGLPRPSWDLWEERRGVHTFTVATVIGALDAAAAFAHDFGEHDRAISYREGAAKMREAKLKWKRSLMHACGIRRCGDLRAWPRPWARGDTAST